MSSAYERLAVSLGRLAAHTQQPVTVKLVVEHPFFGEDNQMEWTFKPRSDQPSDAHADAAEVLLSMLPSKFFHRITDHFSDLIEQNWDTGYDQYLPLIDARTRQEREAEDSAKV